MRDITRQENASREVRENLRLDIANEDFTLEGWLTLMQKK